VLSQKEAFVKPLNVFGELHVTDENGITSVKPTYYVWAL